MVYADNQPYKELIIRILAYEQLANSLEQKLYELEFNMLWSIGVGS